MSCPSEVPSRNSKHELLYNSEQSHRKESKSSRLKAAVSDTQEDHQHNSLIAEGKTPCERQGNPSDGKRGDSIQWSSNGSCSRGAKMCVQAR